MDTSFFAGGPRSPLLNYALCYMIFVMRSGNPVAAVQNFRPGLYLPLSETLRYWPANGIMPAFTLWLFNGGCLVLIDGTSNADHVLAMYEGWDSYQETVRPSGINNAFADAWAMILAQMVTVFEPGNIPYWVVGHSYGGGVAAAAQFSLQNILPGVRCTTISYGSPKVGNFTCATSLGRMGHTRYWLLGDPVPSVPPNDLDVPSLAAILPRDLMKGINAQCPAATGYSISPAGVITQSEGPLLVGTTLILNLLFWLNGPENMNSSLHAVNSYADAFAAAAAAATPALPPPVSIGTIRPRMETQRERDAAIAMGEAAIKSDATSPAGITRNYAPPPVTDPSAPRYRAARDGKAWVIMLGEEVVAAATGKRAAKRIARTWNRAARAALHA